MVWNHARTPGTDAVVARAEVLLECSDDLGTTTTLPTVFTFSADDPFAVTVTFPTADGDLPWSFSRDLLIRGLEEPAGAGDVHVRPVRAFAAPDRVAIHLSSPDGSLVAVARAREVRAFLRRADRIVPAGAESDFLDLDATIGRLLRATV